MGPPRGQSLCSESVVCEGGKIQSALHVLTGKEGGTYNLVGNVHFFVQMGRKFTLHHALESSVTVFPRWLLTPKQKRISQAERNGQDGSGRNRSVSYQPQPPFTR